eukprot:418327_1
MGNTRSKPKNSSVAESVATNQPDNNIKNTVKYYKSQPITKAKPFKINKRPQDDNSDDECNKNETKRASKRDLEIFQKYNEIEKIDPVSRAIIVTIENSYLIKKYNTPSPIIQIVYDYIGMSDDISLWLDASDRSTLTLANDNCSVLEWKSKSNNAVTLQCLNNNSMPKLLIGDDNKHKYINGVQYSFSRTHVMSSPIDVWTILSVHKYKDQRIGKAHATFYILTATPWIAKGNGMWQLHGSNFGSILHSWDRTKADTRNFWLNDVKMDGVKTKYWIDEFKIATLELSLDLFDYPDNALPIKVNQIGKERNCHAFEGVLAECIVYKTAIQKYQMDIIQNYFKNKYRI